MQQAESYLNTNALVLLCISLDNLRGVPPHACAASTKGAHPFWNPTQGCKMRFLLIPAQKSLSAEKVNLSKQSDKFMLVLRLNYVQKYTSCPSHHKAGKCR